MSLDSRPKSICYFGILSNSNKILLFGGDNPERSSYQFDQHKREICKCNVYTGDQDRFMTNQIWEGEEEIIAFGLTRLHIYDKTLGKFTGVKCYDFQVEDGEQIQCIPPEEEKVIEIPSDA